MLSEQELLEIEARCEDDYGGILPDTARNYFSDVPELIDHIRAQESALAAKDAELAHMRRALESACKRDTCLGCPAIDDCRCEVNHPCHEYLADWHECATKDTPCA